MDNIIRSKLYRPGSVAYVSRYVILIFELDIIYVGKNNDFNDIFVNLNINNIKIS